MPHTRDRMLALSCLGFGAHDETHARSTFRVDQILSGCRDCANFRTAGVRSSEKHRHSSSTGNFVVEREEFDSQIVSSCCASVITCL